MGFDRPKGMYPIGPVSGASLFQILAEQIRARSHEAGCSIPYYVMTSDATHEPTIAFFEEHAWFGLERDDLFFFRQGNSPAVDARTGEILLAGPGEIAMGPDGHGGLIAALANSGALEDMARRGLEMLHYHQVDNPTAIVCDPQFLGWHAWRQSDISTKIVAKTSPSERMGVVCEVDGSCRIIEYSDLPAEAANRKDARGEPSFWAGNTAMHVINRAFLETLCDGGHDLPFHTAHKIVPYLDSAGRRIEPDAPNAFKFERFIFDALPLARRALVLEADRGREFNPVKNAQANDSPETARAAMNQIARDWLARAGADVSEDALVEISPLFALDAEQLIRAIPPDSRFEGQVYLRPKQ